MKASRQANDSAVAVMARGMLERAAAVAPEQVAAERRAFDVLCAAYRRDPGRVLAAREGERGSGPLGFGLPGVEELLTPVFLAAATAVVTYLADRVSTASEGMLRRMFDRPAAEDGTLDADPAGEGSGAVRLDHEQWREVRRIVTGTLMRHGGMPRDRAELLAAAVVGDALTGQDAQ